MQWPRSQTQLGRCPFLGGLGVLVVLAASAMGKDVVVVAIGDAGTGQTRKTGIIQDYTGRQLTLRTTSGNELTIATDKVISLETERAEPQLAGDRLLAEDKFREALEAYNRAAGLDRRVWMRRQILAQMVWCLRGMQDIPRAGDTFLLILQSDPHTQYFAAMPLNWLDGQRPAGIAQRSNEWLTAKPPAARLLGASWLLATEDRGQAVSTLQALQHNADPRIAILAEAQLWRTQTVTANGDDTAHWQQLIRRLPVPLRAGPYWVLGRTLARQGQHPQAALAFLRAPILDREQRNLAAHCLLAAGDALVHAGDHSGARRIYDELSGDFAGMQPAELALQRIQQLDGLRDHDRE